MNDFLAARYSPDGMGPWGTLNWQQKLGLMAGGGGGGMNPWAKFGMQAGMNAPQLPNAINSLSGLMSLAKHKQRPYEQEIRPQTPMPSVVDLMIQRGLMG